MRSVPQRVHSLIQDVRQRVEAFQDRWDMPQIEQFVAADYELVYQTLDWIRESQLLIGNRFLEWGCGFAAVAVMAGELGWDSIGIESEQVLLKHGNETVEDWSSAGASPELIAGNFLPNGAEQLAEDPTLPSLGHGGESAYTVIGLDLDDFAVVYSYPWPGEDDFHELVFDRYGSVGGLLVQFCGPNETRVWRKRAK